MAAALELRTTLLRSEETAHAAQQTAAPLPPGLGSWAQLSLAQRQQALAANERNSASLGHPEFWLPILADWAWLAQDYTKAQIYSEQALLLVTVGNNPAYNARLSYWAHHVLGLLALVQNDVAGAKYHLAESASTNSVSIHLQTVGPNMGLASALLDAGERDAALAFVNSIQPVWKSGSNKLSLWQVTIENGAKPAFGAQLDVLP